MCMFRVYVCISDMDVVVVKLGFLGQNSRQNVLLPIYVKIVSK